MLWFYKWNRITCQKFQFRSLRYNLNKTNMAISRAVGARHLQISFFYIDHLCATPLAHPSLSLCAALLSFSFLFTHQVTEWILWPLIYDYFIFWGEWYLLMPVGKPKVVQQSLHTHSILPLIYDTNLIVLIIIIIIIIKPFDISGSINIHSCCTSGGLLMFAVADLDWVGWWYRTHEVFILLCNN